MAFFTNLGEDGRSSSLREPRALSSGMQIDLASAECSIGTSWGYLQMVTLGAKGHGVKVRSWAGGDIAGRIKMVREKAKKARK